MYVSFQIRGKKLSLTSKKHTCSMLEHTLTHNSIISKDFLKRI